MRRTIFLTVIIAGFFAGCRTSKSPEKPIAETPAPTSQDNSKNSVDWPGLYRGTLPCADCEGIVTEIKLNSDLTYEMAYKYAGKSDEIFREKGIFRWNENGRKITLTGGSQPEAISQYQVGENLLWKLDGSGERITGNLAEKYVLRKGNSDQTITEKYWKLVELNGRPITVVPDQIREPHLVLRIGNNRVTGHTGCNAFNGTYELEAGNKISFKPMATTGMACQNITYENEYLRVFGSVDNYTLKGDTLLLSKANKAALARFVVVYLR